MSIFRHLNIVVWASEITECPQLPLFSEGEKRNKSLLQKVSQLQTGKAQSREISLYSFCDMDFSLHGCCDPNQTRVAGILLGWHSTALSVLLPTDSSTKDCNSLQKLCLNSPICAHSCCEGLGNFTQANWANCRRNGGNSFPQKPLWPVLPSSTGVVDNILILTKL